MTWDPVWDEIFKSRGGWGKYPPEELVRFMARHYFSATDRNTIRVLEVGCGPAGGPSRFLAREGFDYFGIDGSPAAVEMAERFFVEQKLKGKFKVATLEDLPFENESFDCVIDVGCLACNSEKNTALALSEISRVLKPAGRHFSLTVKDGTWGHGTGTQVDETTWKDVSEGPVHGMGVIRFATDTSLRKLYANFNLIELDYSVRSVGNQAHEVGHWIVSVQK